MMAMGHLLVEARTETCASAGRKIAKRGLEHRKRATAVGRPIGTAAALIQQQLNSAVLTY
jgi:hypothetical protein